jgi:hypothetical protein
LRNIQQALNQNDIQQVRLAFQLLVNPHILAKAVRIPKMKNRPHSEHQPSAQSQNQDAWNRKDLGKLAQALAQLLDASLTIPGTRIKIGLDPLIGLIPGIGDFISNAIGSSLLVLATKAGVPRIVILRMSLNIIINMMIGVIPGIGDLFSIWFKSNLKNAQLLHRHCQTTAPVPTLIDWVYVGTIVIGMFLLLVITCAFLFWLGSSLFRLLGLTE